MPATAETTHDVVVLGGGSTVEQLVQSRSVVLSHSGGKPMAEEMESDIKVANQVILHDTQHPSSLLLPVIPAAGGKTREDR